MVMTSSMTLETLASMLLPRPQLGRIFSENERRTLAAAADVLLEGVDFDISADVVVRNIERFIGGSRRAWRVRVLLEIVELAPLAVGQLPFSRGTKEQRTRFIREKVATGGHLWVLCRRIRPLIHLGAYATPDARRRVGWIEVENRVRFLSVAA